MYVLVWNIPPVETVTRVGYVKCASLCSCSGRSIYDVNSTLKSENQAHNCQLSIVFTSIQFQLSSRTLTTMSPLKIDSSETSTNSLCSCHCHCHEEEIEPLKSKSIEFVDDSAVGSDEIPSSISESRHSMSSKTKKRVSFGRECVREYNVVSERMELGQIFHHMS